MSPFLCITNKPQTNAPNRSNTGGHMTLSVLATHLRYVSQRAALRLIIWVTEISKHEKGQVAYIAENETP